MKKISMLVLITVLFSITGFAQNVFYDAMDIAALEAKSQSKIRDFRESKLGDNYDLKYLRFNLYIDPDTLFVSGSVTSRFVTIANNVSQIHFELSSLLTVDSVIFHNNHAVFSHINDDLSIQLGTSYPQYHPDSITVFYHGVPSAGLGFGSFIKDYHNGTPIIWTLSEPYGTKDWWPCKNSLTDKIDSIDVLVTTPAMYRAAGNGLLVQEYTAGINKVYHWKHRYPIAAYLIAVAVTNYSFYYDYAMDNGDSIKILNYVYPENLSDWQANTPAVVLAMNVFDSLFGTYPFIKEKYGHAQFNWGGGMEHQTMTFLVSYWFELMSHELSHQWFGNKVTCSSWHDIWVNEGFATYLTGLSYEHTQNGIWWPVWKKQQIASIISDTGGSVYCYDTSTVARVFDSRLSYRKGGMVLHMLRWKLGDVAFYQAMNDLLNDPQHAYSFASTEDVRQHFEVAGSTSLTGFFDDWVYKEGYPIYTINCMALQDSSVQLTIHQTQSHSSVSFFELPVPIKFKNAQHDTVIVFDNTFSGQVWGFNPGFVPDSVIFDPQNWLVAKLDTLLVTKVEKNVFPAARIFPNPTHELLEINLPGYPISALDLFDATGRRCFSQNTGTVETACVIDMRLYPPGNYLLIISSGNNKFPYKIVRD